MAPPLLRGTTEYADCANCPFARNGQPNNPVLAEFPEKPAFLLIGDHPGRNETLFRRPFIGETGKIVEKMLGASGRTRSEVLIGNAFLCLPTDDPHLKEQAAKACSMRLKMELRRFPGVPILSLGSIAARAIIPKATLDAIDPPEGAPSHKRKQKAKLATLNKAAQAQARKLDKLRDQLKVQYLDAFIKTQDFRQALLKDLAIRYPRPPKLEKGVSSALRAKHKEAFTESTRKRHLAVIEYLQKHDEKTLTAILQRVDDELEANSIEVIWAQQKAERLTKKTQTREERIRREALSEIYVRSGLADPGTKALTKAQLDKIEGKLTKENPALLEKLRQQATLAANKILTEDLVQREATQRAQAAGQEELEKQKKRHHKKIGITDIAGTVFKVDVDGTGERVVIPTINPAAIMRSAGRALLGAHTPDLAFWNVVSDAAKLNAIANGKDIFLHFPIQVEWNDSVRAAELFLEFYRRALDHGSFALDLETYVEDNERHHALQAYKAKIRAIGFATDDWAISVLWDLLPSWCLALLKYLLLSQRVTKIYHNGLYDRTVLAANSFPSAGPWQDTLLKHHVTFPGAAHGLQTVTAQFYAVTPWKSEFRNNEETPEALTKYNAKDTFSTKKIDNALTVWIQRTNTERIYDLDKKMSACASGMHLDGVPVNREANQELLTQFLTARTESRERVEAITRDPETLKLIWHHLAFEQAGKRRKLDPESFTERHKLRMAEMAEASEKRKWFWKISANQHVAALLRSQGVQLMARTQTGLTKVNKEILEALVEVPAVREVLRFRENDKLISTFIWPLFDRELADGSVSYGFADPDDRVHPIWSIHKISGRWASSDPVCSNIPKSKIRKMPDGSKKILRPNIRRQFIAPPRRTFVGFDFAQLEARILAMVSKDAFLCWVFNSKLDIHREAARIIWPEFDTLNESFQKQLRDNAKPFEYGAFYGADPSTLYKQLLKEGYAITEADVYKAYFTLMNKLQGVAAYQQNVVDFAMKPPFTLQTFLMQRKRIFPLGNADRNECLNWPIQAAGADIMNFGMSRMMERIVNYRQAFPILQIHDAAVFECWEDDAEAILADVIECFTQEHVVDGVTIPFPVDAKIARSWADL